MLKILKRMITWSLMLCLFSGALGMAWAEGGDPPPIDWNWLENRGVDSAPTSERLKITVQPKSQTVEAGEEVTFSVETSRTDVTYQWETCNLGTDRWTVISASSAKERELTFTASSKEDGGRYRCKVTDEDGQTACSYAVKLTVEPNQKTASEALKITVQPKSQTVEAGEEVTFSVEASRTDVTYQWETCNPDTDRWTVVSASSAKERELTFTASSKEDGGRYRCKVTDEDGQTACSYAVKLTVEPNQKAEAQVRLAAGAYFSVGLKSDGTVVATGLKVNGQCDVSGWTDIAAIAAGFRHTVGLKSNGTVVATGVNDSGECDVSGWNDIVAVAAGDSYTVGLKGDGTVVATGYDKFGQCDVYGWKDIVAIAAGESCTVGLKSDGTVVAAGYGQGSVKRWTDIAAIAAGFRHTVGLKSDGTVVATGANDDGQCDVSGWKDIVAIAAGESHTVGLKSDGTVIAVGYNVWDECEVSEWEDIVAIAAGRNYTLGLKRDGTVVATGDNGFKQCDVSGWQLTGTD